MKYTDMHINHTLPLDLFVTDKSNVILRGNYNTSLHKMYLSSESVLTISHCFTPVIDIQIDNSMLYIDQLNHIDSLKANLVGKSNIKRINDKYETDDFTALMKKFNIEHNEVHIYPTGNKEYFEKQGNASADNS